MDVLTSEQELDADFVEEIALDEEDVLADQRHEAELWEEVPPEGLIRRVHG